jgi:hypothetical protein
VTPTELGVSLRVCVKTMPHLRLASDVAVNPLFQFTIRSCLSRVLA